MAQVGTVVSHPPDDLYMVVLVAFDSLMVLVAGILFVVVGI